MKEQGPQLESLLRRLADCPPEFLEIATKKVSVGIDIVAVVCDLLRMVDPAQPPEQEDRALTRLRSCGERQLALVSVVCWLLADQWFIARPQLAPSIWQLLLSDRLLKLSELQRAEKFVTDPDRREELVRTCLALLQLRPQGETAAQASDRLATLDSAGRDRVLRETAAAERRAREIREAMARQKALESASRYGE